MYDAATSRMLSPDTHWNSHNRIYGDNPGKLVPNKLAIMQSSNSYAYALNNPFRYFDPSGLEIKFSQESWAAFKTWKEDYDRAIEYLKQSSEFRNLYNTLLTSEEVFWIHFRTDQYNAFVAEGDANRNWIYWDSRHGLVLKDDTVMSPALILAHEMGHAERYANGDYWGRYYNQTIESDNLTRWEDPIARQLGEYVREDYDFVASSNKYVKVKTSTDWGIAPLNTDKAWYKPWTWFQPIRCFTNQNNWNPVDAVSGAAPKSP